MNRRHFMISAAASMTVSADVASAQWGLLQPAPFRVVVDPRIELMSTVHLLGGYFLTTRSMSAYRAKAQAYFSRHVNHPAVGMARHHARRSFARSDVPDMMLRLTNPGEMAMRTDLLAQTPRGIPNPVARQSFLSALRDFAQVTRFQEFYDWHRPFYGSIAARVGPFVEPSVQSLERYVGTSLSHWQTIASPLMHDGGFAVHLKRRDGLLETYALLGPEATSIGAPHFGDRSRLQNLIVHEFGHSLLNPLAAQHPDLLAQLSERFDPLRGSMKRQGYSDWPTVVNEHVIRAVTARLAALVGGEQASDRTVTTEFARGFVYVPRLVERLRVYERDRGRWPTLSTFYPELLGAFDQARPEAI